MWRLAGSLYNFCCFVACAAPSVNDTLLSVVHQLLGTIFQTHSSIKVKGLPQEGVEIPVGDERGKSPLFLGETLSQQYGDCKL